MHNTSSILQPARSTRGRKKLGVQRGEREILPVLRQPGHVATRPRYGVAASFHSMIATARIA